MTSMQLRQSFSFPGNPGNTGDIVNYNVITRSDLSSLNIWDDFLVQIQDSNDMFYGFSYGDKTIIEILQYHREFYDRLSNQDFSRVPHAIEIDSLQSNHQFMLIYNTLKKLQIDFTEQTSYYTGDDRFSIDLSKLWQIPSLSNFTEKYENIYNISANLPNHPIRLFYRTIYSSLNSRNIRTDTPFINIDFDTYFQYIKLFNDISNNLNNNNNINTAIITNDHIINNYNWLHPDLIQNTSRQQSINPSLPSPISTNHVSNQPYSSVNTSRSSTSNAPTILSEISDIVFDIKENISDSQYMDLMNKLSQLNTHFQI
jgi:hypothetical protein